VYAMLGMNDDAINWLSRAIAMGNENYPWIASNPLWSPLKEEPRFQQILGDLKQHWEHLKQSNAVHNE